MFTVMFAVARSIGWICHWREMMSESTFKIGFFSFFIFIIKNELIFFSLYFIRKTKATLCWRG
jgi:hypothetical protein